MPSKKKGDTGSKKALQKKKDKLIEDKTFGLKNKKKSKKVQNQIASITKNIKDGGLNPKMRKIEEQKKAAKSEAKARKKAMEEERNALFGEALLAVSKKTTVKTKAASEAKGRDHDDGETKKSGQSRAMKMMFQMDAKEMEEALTSDPNYVRTLEDEVELQRQKKLAELKGKGTPVTPETFAAWQERKRQRKMEESKKLVEKELKKKKGGKGLSVLSGRALYEYKRDLFVDDEGANDNIKDPTTTVDCNTKNEDDDIQQVVEKVQETTLFLEGDDDDLDDLDDD